MTPEDVAYQTFLTELAQLEETPVQEVPEHDLSTGDTYLECSFRFNSLRDYIASTDSYTF